MMFLIITSLLIGQLTGLLGIGGGLLLVPAVVYMSPWFTGGDPVLSLPMATGIGAVQGLAGCNASLMVHWRQGHCLRNWLNWMLLPLTLSALAGGWLSRFTPTFWLDALLKLVLVWAVAMGAFNYWRKYLRPKPVAASLIAPASSFEPALTLKQGVRLALLSALVGGVAGLLGIGGAIFLLPLLLDVLKVPLPLAVGTITVLVWCSSASTVVGKWQAGLLPWPETWVVVAAASLGGWLGAALQRWASEPLLRLVHLSVLVVVLAQALWSPG
jgi:uncharacterized protein